MKATSLDYARAGSLAEAAALLAEGGDGARPLSGGQSLGPMLNLRLASPRLLVDLRHIPELRGIEETAEALTIGAAITHAAIEDRRVPDIGHDVLPRVAGGIAYRAVRNRGTIGGGLAHADPAADWVSALTALDATVLTYAAAGTRAMPIGAFILGAFHTSLLPGEFIQAIRIPRLSPAARWGWYKVCRKPGEFAASIGAILHDPPRGVYRAVMGATGGRPVLLTGGGPLDAPLDAGKALAAEASELDAIDRHIHTVALKRALAMIQP
ncbi:MAG TPA: FAD binding domain-containing protein [Stellaceae bacterium]|nr:FAD binding domain-containing protein [Stellaceae bacterium]